MDHEHRSGYFYYPSRLLSCAVTNRTLSLKNTEFKTGVSLVLCSYRRYFYQCTLLVHVTTNPNVTSGRWRPEPGHFISSLARNAPGYETELRLRGAAPIQSARAAR